MLRDTGNLPVGYPAMFKQTRLYTRLAAEYLRYHSHHDSNFTMREYQDIIDETVPKSGGIWQCFAEKAVKYIACDLIAEYENAYYAMLELCLDSETEGAIASKDVVNALLKSGAILEFTTMEDMRAAAEAAAARGTFWHYVFEQTLDMMTDWQAGLPSIEFIDTYKPRGL